MLQLIVELETADDSSVEALQTAVKGWITQNEIGFGKIMMPLRVALVGALEGVDVFDIIYLIGKSETIKRIQSLIDLSLALVYSLGFTMESKLLQRLMALVFLTQPLVFL